MEKMKFKHAFEISPQLPESYSYINFRCGDHHNGEKFMKGFYTFLVFTKRLTEQHGTKLLLNSMRIILKLIPDSQKKLKISKQQNFTYVRKFFYIHGTSGRVYCNQTQSVMYREGRNLEFLASRFINHFIFKTIKKFHPNLKGSIKHIH